MSNKSSHLSSYLHSGRCLQDATKSRSQKNSINRYKQNTHIKSKGQCKDKQCQKKNSYIFLLKNDCKTPYIDIFIQLLSINFNLLSVLQHYAYHQISDFEINTSLTTILQLNTLFFVTQLVLYQIIFCLYAFRNPS